MQSDSLTRLLLVVMAVCLLVLVVRSFQDGDGNAAGWGRYQVTGMRAGAPVLIRSDTVTGQVWKLELRGGGGKWVAFTEPDADDADDGSQTSAREPKSAGAVDTASVKREIIEPPGAPTEPAAIVKPRRVRNPQSPPSPVALSAGATGDQEIAALRQAITNPELPIDMRVWAAQRLVSIEDPRATKALLEALGDPDAEVAFAAVEALNESEDDEVKAAVEKLREAGDDTVRDRLDGGME